MCLFDGEQSGKARGSGDSLFCFVKMWCEDNIVERCRRDDNDFSRTPTRIWKSYRQQHVCRAIADDATPLVNITKICLGSFCFRIYIHFTGVMPLLLFLTLSSCRLRPLHTILSVFKKLLRLVCCRVQCSSSILYLTVGLCGAFVCLKK